MIEQMVENFLFNFVCPFLGTVAFSILFNVPKRFYFSCGLVGAMGWVMYCVTVGYTSAAVASFLGSLVVVLLSRILTVRMKCPITIFLISGIFPLVPGAGVYYTAYYLVMNQLAEAAHRGLGAVKVAFAIVLGIVLIVSIPREFFQPRYWKKRWYIRRSAKRS